MSSISRSPTPHGPDPWAAIGPATTKHSFNNRQNTSQAILARNESPCTCYQRFPEVFWQVFCSLCGSPASSPRLGLCHKFFQRKVWDEGRVVQVAVALGASRRLLQATQNARMAEGVAAFGHVSLQWVNFTFLQKCMIIYVLVQI